VPIAALIALSAVVIVEAFWNPPKRTVWEQKFLGNVPPRGKDGMGEEVSGSVVPPEGGMGGISGSACRQVAYRPRL
jgi:hypothetical protein